MKYLDEIGEVESAIEKAKTLASLIADTHDSIYIAENTLFWAGRKSSFVEVRNRFELLDLYNKKKKEKNIYIYY